MVLSALTIPVVESSHSANRVRTSARVTAPHKLTAASWLPVSLWSDDDGAVAADEDEAGVGSFDDCVQGESEKPFSEKMS